MMEIRFQNSPLEVKSMPTGELRRNFLCEELVKDGEISYIYFHYDRIIVGGVKPIDTSIPLRTDHELRAEYFLERREMGIINIGGKGSVQADNIQYDLEKLSCLYLGKNVQDVQFSSTDKNNPAVFFLLSTPAHHVYPPRLMNKEEALPVSLGNAETSNRRTIYKYIHAEGIQSCQLVMGLTVLDEGNVWNSMPPHTHTRRTEVYFYFDLNEQQRIFHFMGEPQQTRHVVISNQQAVISPPWSIHCGCGTSDYSFIWGMAGENYTFADMDPAPVTELR